MWNPFVDVSKGAVEGLGNAVKNAVSAFKADPTKVAELEVDLQKAVLDTGVKLDNAAARALESVNATMREEAKSEHWLQWSWRPMGAYVFYTMVINNFVVYPYLYNYMAKMELSESLFLCFMAILGVASFTRGWAQVMQAKNGNGSENK